MYDHDYSRKAARATFTAGFCANCGLQSETILNIIHFLYYDSDPFKNGGNYTNPEDNKDSETGKVKFNDGQFLKVGKYNFCTLDMISHRGGKTLDNTTQDELQKIDENDCNGYVEHNYFATNALPTAMLVLKICLTSKCAEEAVTKILRAAGDSDTIAAAAMPIIAALFGLPKDWVEKIWVYSMQTKKMTTEDQTKENTKNDGEPDDLKNIKKFDEHGNFIYHNEINRLADKTYGHHYRENAKIEWQLRNIYELMEYLVKEKENSKAENKELLNYIFKRIRADIDFMLDRNQEYELEKEPELDITEEEIERAKKLTEEEALSSKESHELRLKYLRAKNKVRIYKHRNATARFQTKAKNDKLNNLTQENIANIKTELNKINNLFCQNGIDQKIEANTYEALIENNDKIDLVKQNDFYDDKIYNDMYAYAVETLEIKKKKDAEYIAVAKLQAVKQGQYTNTKIIFWTRKKKLVCSALVIIAVNVVLFWQLSFAVAFWSALGTWVLYFFVLWLINRFNGSEPIDTIGTKGQNNDKNPVTVKGKTKEITQPLIGNKNNQIIDPNQKNNLN